MCGTTGNERASLFQCKHYFVCITPSLVLKVQVINWILLNTYFSYFCQDEMSPSKNVFQLLCGFYDILLLCFFLPPIPRSRSSCLLLFESLLSEKKINWNKLFLYFFYVLSVLLPLHLFQFTCITFITCGTLLLFFSFSLEGLQPSRLPQNLSQFYFCYQSHFLLCLNSTILLLCFFDVRYIPWSPLH